MKSTHLPLADVKGQWTTAPAGVHRIDDVHVFAFHGDIDFSRRWWIERELAQLERFGVNSRTVLDLTRVTYLDSAFLNALAALHRRLVEYPSSNQICVVTTAHSHVRRLLHITHLDRVFRILEAGATLDPGEVQESDFRSGGPARSKRRRVLNTR